VDETVKSDVKSDVEALRSDFKQVKEDLLNLTRTFSQFTARQAGDGVADLRQARERAEAHLRQVAGEARDSLEQQVKEKPLGTLLIAFGVGLLIGKTMSR